MPKYNDFDLDLQNTNLYESSIEMKKTGPGCIVYSGRYTCDDVSYCVCPSENYKCAPIITRSRCEILE